MCIRDRVSAILTQKTPPKFKDPGSPTISCIIGDYRIERALLDLGASVNLIPYSVYEQLGLGELKPTKTTLQLADRSIRVPRGIVEDILVQVDKFYYPVDFIVLDTQPVLDASTQIPVILGRPFLATSNAIINCRNGVMQLSFGNMTLEVNVFHLGKRHRDVDDDEFFEVNMLESFEEEELLQLELLESLETCLAHFMDSENPIISEIVQALNIERPVVDTSRWRPHFEKLPPTTSRPLPSNIKPPKLDLKPLPSELKYVYFCLLYTSPSPRD